MTAQCNITLSRIQTCNHLRGSSELSHCAKCTYGRLVRLTEKREEEKKMGRGRGLSHNLCKTQSFSIKWNILKYRREDLLPKENQWSCIMIWIMRRKSPKGARHLPSRHTGYAQHCSQGTESVAKALWDSNRKDGISRSKEGNGG